MGDYNRIEPGTDLGLSLGYTDQYIQGRLTNKLGVGANAGLMVDMKYVTTDSLSELVWSPHKGLSLRCADSSFNNRKSSKLWNAAASNPSLALPQSVVAEKSTSNNLLDNRTIILSQAESHSARNLHTHTPAKGVGSNANATISRAKVSAVCFKQEDLQKSGGVDITEAGNIPVNEVLTIGRNDSSYLPVEMNIIDQVSVKQDEPELHKLQNKLLDLDSIRGDTNEDRNITTGKDVLHPTILGKLESSAENDLQIMNDKNIVNVMNSSHEVRGSNQQDEKDNCINRGDSTSPNSCDIPWVQRKGKEKALSDGDVNVHGRMLNNEDNSSYGSVESCSNAFLSTSKRRWSFEQPLVVGNKRAKRKDNNAPGPSSNFVQDSSFMNWISNMTKGFLASVQDEAPPSLDLTLPKPDAEHGNLNKKPMNKKSNPPGFSGVGFLSIFRSLYSPIMKGEDGAPNATCQAKEEAEEIEVIRNTCDLNATPIACFGEPDNFRRQLHMNNEPTLPIQLKNSPEISCGSQQSHKTGSHENCNSYNSALDKCKSNSIENGDCDLPCEKTDFTTGNTSDPHKSLWISRFTEKTPGFMANPETCNLHTKDDSKCSIHSARLIPCPQNHNDHHSVDGLDTAVSKEQCNTSNSEVSSSHKEFTSQYEQKSINKFKSALRSPKLRSPEAMASIFSRRLGAFKHILPSNLTLSIGHETVTCFFCGTRGHNLHNCSKITEREIEKLSRNVRLCKETVDAPFSCIRCFQLNHWAIECPLAASSGRPQQSEPHAALADRYDAGDLQLTSGVSLRSNRQHVEDRKIDSTEDPNIKTDLRLDCKVTDEVKSAAISTPKCAIPRFAEKNSNVPQAVFNAVKKLRLTRRNILKYMNSNMSLSHLDGFFLRIRLGKWEEGLGGTGYDVACIRGVQLANNSITVLVRGVECQVQAKYISNHDFLEDELRAWWCTASGKRVLPQAADLRAKVKKRKDLGL